MQGPRTLRPVAMAFCALTASVCAFVPRHLQQASRGRVVSSLKCAAQRSRSLRVLRSPPLAHRGHTRLYAAAAEPQTLTLAELAAPHKGAPQRFIFFGGKGGVGKTSTSTAIAVSLADRGLRTLVISTDPAHSLGDILGEEVGGGKPVAVFGCDNLYAMEVDAVKALENFKALFNGLDVPSLAKQFGVGEELLATVGIEEFVEILNDPPPGIDELIALADVIRLAKDTTGGGFDRIVIDTAPTGHTLRLLSFPDFIDSFLGKLVKLQLKVSKFLNSVSGIFGSGSKEAEERAQKTEAAFKRIERAKDQMVELKQLFRNSQATEFCIVSIATHLAVAESKRLVRALKEEGISVRHLIVNKLVTDGDQSGHLERIVRGQDKSLARLEKGIVQELGLKAVQVPYFDVEVRGLYGLRFMGDVAFSGGAFKDLLQPTETAKYVIMGGKGGVGKTSSSAALAVKFANDGFNTLVVSTDPAHSLGDSLEMDLSSGRVSEVPGFYTGGRLHALEVDTAEAVKEFKGLIKGLGQGVKQAQEGGGGGGGMGSAILNQLNLDEFAEALDSVPPGADELVALVQVLKLIKSGAPDSGQPFDRIVIDTAPSGHTLRLLSFPAFLNDFFERIARLRDRVSSATSFLNILNKKGSDGDGLHEKRDRLREFQYKMLEVDQLLHDRDNTEFVAVTIATEMAVAETERLARTLVKDDFVVKRLIINQLLSADSQQTYWDRLKLGQREQLREIERTAAAEGLTITKVPYFDTEMRTVYGVRVLGDELVNGGMDQGRPTTAK